MKSSKKKKLVIISSIITIVTFICLCVLILFGITMTSQKQYFVMDGPSMKPTYNHGDRLVVQQQDNYMIDEVVVIKYKDTHVVKRIIGIPGDKIEVLSDKIITNNGESIISDINTQTPDTYYLESNYFVLGDNYPISLDSRYPMFGLISKSEIVGKVIN